MKDTLSTRTTNAEQALRENEQRFRAFVVASSDVVYRMGPDWSEMRELDGQGFLADMIEPTEGWMEHYIRLPDRKEIQDAIDKAIRAKQMFELEHRVVRADGTLGWIHSRAVPILDEQGAIVEWLGAGSDVTARRESEERYRLLYEFIDEGFCIIEVLFDAANSPVDYRFLQANPAFERQTGLAEVIGKTMRDLAPGHEQRWYDVYGRIALTGEPERFEDPAAALGRWYDVYAFRIGSPDERQVGVLFRDIKERKRAEEALRESEGRLRLLTAELQHRVRNILGMVRSLARQSIEGHSTVEDYVGHLIGRLDAIARTQVLLTSDAGVLVDLEGLVREELIAQSGAMEFQVDGPEVRLSAKAAEVLTLALHELATNSVKYGVLGDRDGWLKVKWSLTTHDRRTWVHIQWDEFCGNCGTEVVRPGFGTELIEQRVPFELRGTASLEVNQDGVRARIDFPIDDRASIFETGPERETS